MTYAKVAAISYTWQSASVTNRQPDDFTLDKPIKPRKRTEKETLATAKSKKDKQEKRIRKNPRLHRPNCFRDFHTSQRGMFYLKRAQQAASLTCLCHTVSVSFIQRCPPISLAPLSNVKSGFTSRHQCKQPLANVKSVLSSKISTMWFICGDVHGMFNTWEWVRVQGGITHPIKCSQRP